MSINIEQFLTCGAIMSLTHERLLLGWGEPRPAPDSPIDPDSPSFYFTDFFLSSANPWMHYSHWCECTLQEFKDLLQSTSPPPSPAHWILQNPEQFQQAFQELSKELQTGLLKKGVPYLFAKSFFPMTEERLSCSLKRSTAALEKKAGYLYGQWKGGQGILGVTPEVLFSHSGQEPRTIHTMAVAGTTHPSQDLEAFFHNEKERYEHQLVVEGISQSLQQLGYVKVGAIQLLHLPKLVHLMTPIVLTLTQPFQFDSLVKQLHPTPALGAFPVMEGKKWLAAFEQHTPRHCFGAPIGFHHPGAGLSRCFVAIRNVQWDSTGMRIGAGCGVVKQSTFEKEWKEIQIKIRAIRDQLHL